MLHTYLQHQIRSREAGLVLCEDRVACEQALVQLADEGWQHARSSTEFVVLLTAGQRASWRLCSELPHQVYEFLCNLPHGDAPVLHGDGAVTREKLPDGANLILVGTRADLHALEEKGLDLRSRTGMTTTFADPAAVLA